MKISNLTITIKDLIEGYDNKAEDKDLVGYNGKLVIKPAFQRNFIYDLPQQHELMRSISKGYPINIMYWSDKNGKFELLDGQQRTLTICKFITTNIPVTGLFYNPNPRTYKNLNDEEREKINNYKLEIKICDGTDTEKLEWFEIINIKSQELSRQELLNAVYSGSFISSAREHFSSQSSGFYRMLNPLIKKDINRQEYLETVLDWFSKSQNLSIKEYLALHQNDADDRELVEYVNSVYNWVVSLFKIRDVMKGLPWGVLYNKYAENSHLYNKEEFEVSIKNLLENDEIKKQSGIYEYLLDVNNPNRESHLGLRTFTKAQKTKVYEKQNHKCGHCNKECSLTELEAHHKIAWSEGGVTETENCILLCKDCHSQETRRLLQR